MPTKGPQRSNGTPGGTGRRKNIAGIRPMEYHNCGSGSPCPLVILGHLVSPEKLFLSQKLLLLRLYAARLACFGLLRPLLAVVVEVLSASATSLTRL